MWKKKKKATIGFWVNFECETNRICRWIGYEIWETESYPVEGKYEDVDRIHRPVDSTCEMKSESSHIAHFSTPVTVQATAGCPQDAVHTRRRGFLSDYVK